MIWKDYLKLSENAGYSKLARASKAPPPPPGIGLKLFLSYIQEDLFLTFSQSILVLLFPHPLDLQKKTPNEL